MPTVVFDTNVLIAAALSRSGVPWRALNRIERHYRLAFTSETFIELQNTIHRPRFDQQISRRERGRYLHHVRAIAEFYRIEGGVSVSRDPRDDVLLHLALAVNAVALVTGDRDLLVLGDFAGIPILSPSRFLRAERSIRRGRRERGE